MMQEGSGREGEEARAMVEGKLLIRARLNACLGSHFPCRSSPWPKEDERRSVIGSGRRGREGGKEKWGAARGRLRMREVRKGCGEGDDGTPTPAGGTGLMKSVCPVKVKINWRSGGGYRDNQPGPVVFKLSRSAPPIASPLAIKESDRESPSRRIHRLQ